MKVLQLSTDYCGTLVYKNIVKALRQLNVDQLVYIPIRKRIEINKNLVEDVEFVYSLIYKHWMKIFYFSRIKVISNDIKLKIDLNKIKLIHTHFLFTDGGVAYRLKQERGIKYITTIRNTDVNHYFKYFLHLRYFAIKIMLNAEYIVFLTPVYRDFVINRYVPSKYRKEFFNKSRIIPNGVDEYWHENKVNIPKFLNGDIRFIFVGQLSKNKNLHTVIDFIKQYSIIRNCSLLVIGPKGDYYSVLSNKLNKKNIYYLGEINDKSKLKEYLYHSDIFILPSINETFGLVYIEAMTQGLPCIYSKGQAIDGYFKDGVIGYPVQSSEVTDIIKKVNMIVDNYNVISLNCINKSISFTWSNTVNLFKTLYFETNHN